MQNQALIGFLRGLAYAVIGAVVTYITNNLGGSGLVSASLASLIVATVGIIDHAFLPTP